MMKLRDTRKRSWKKAGLTLIEIIVSSLVLVLIAGSTYFVMSHFDGQVRDSADKLLAMQIAQNYIAQVKSAVLSGGEFPRETDPQNTQDYIRFCSAGCVGAPEGTTDVNLQRLQYSTQLQQAEMHVRVIPMTDRGKQIIVNVLYPRRMGNGNEPITLTDFIYVP